MMSLLLLLFIAAFPCRMLDAHTEESADFKPKSEWYTRYPFYPEYCSTSRVMDEQRKIPSLAESGRYGKTQILHASVIIRHGARTPWGTDQTCWKGYWQDPKVAVWNCRLTQFSAPPPQELIQQEEKEEENNSDKDKVHNQSVVFFDKRYDALAHHPKNNRGQHEDILKNDLNGTCQVGQLLLQGYDQQITNGKHLRDAYCYSSTTTEKDDDDALNLLNLNDEPFEYPNLSFRSDDDERTVQSGQVLIRGMLGPELKQYTLDTKQHPVIPLHTADRERDVLDANSRTCPRIEELREAADSSNQYKALNTSTEAQELRNWMTSNLGQVVENTDCLMTTICTDRPLPDAINDYNGEHVQDGLRMLQNTSNNSTNTSDNNLDWSDYDDDPHENETTAPKQQQQEEGSSSSTTTNEKGYFERIYEFNVQRDVFRFLYNKAAFSRLGIAPLWREIMTNILPILHPEHYDQYNEKPTTTKLALFSGHDTTILPLMATLGPRVWNDTNWPPYASMMIVEIHDLTVDDVVDRSAFKSNVAFRLIYNGQVMTHLVDGCPSGLELCDATVLEQRTAFAFEPLKCHAKNEESDASSTSTLAQAENLLQSTGGIVLVVFVVLASCIVGGLCMHLYLTRRLFPSRAMYYRRRSTEQGLSLTLQNGSNLYGSANDATAGTSKDDDDDSDDGFI